MRLFTEPCSHTSSTGAGATAVLAGLGVRHAVKAASVLARTIIATVRMNAITISLNVSSSPLVQSHRPRLHLLHDGRRIPSMPLTLQRPAPGIERVIDHRSDFQQFLIVRDVRAET